MHAKGVLMNDNVQMDAGQPYTVVFVNNSPSAGNFCLYQKDPNMNVPNVMSLAWFTKYTYPTTKASFTWSIDYSFVWSETGQLVPGVLFLASQTVPAGLTSNNTITLDYNQAYVFKNQQTGTPSGSLVINDSATVPVNKASVGIGMSGAGTFVVQAQPNTTQTFTPHPQYWATFGNYQQGQVLDVQNMVSQSVQINFPPNSYTVLVTLNPDNTWTVGSLAQFNQNLLNAMQDKGI